MTMMMYRGFEHDGSRQLQDRSPAEMIYRTVRHDGLSTVAVVDRANLRLRYRGYWHSGATTGLAAPVLHGGLQGHPDSFLHEPSVAA
jgi:hypothetical protein